jgi:ribosomal protein L27
MRTLPLLLLFAASIALAQTASEPEAASEPKTLKERLGDKASDDQRVDNCKVPVNERGTKPRPDECPR